MKKLENIIIYKSDEKIDEILAESLRQALNGEGKPIDIVFDSILESVKSE